MVRTIISARTSSHVILRRIDYMYAYRHRFHDPPSSKYYYANMRSSKSTWTRPELDPWFLDDSILLSFEPREMTALKALFVEDMVGVLLDCSLF